MASVFLLLPHPRKSLILCAFVHIIIMDYCAHFEGSYMDYMTIREAAEKWNLGIRRVQFMCESGRLDGVKRFGHAWAIPADMEKPADARVKHGKYIKKKDGADND